MYTQTIFVLAVILAYAGVFLVFRKKYLSLFGGIEYLFIGFFISFLPVDTSALKPLLYPFLGWIGLLIGLQLKFSYLKGLPRNFYIKVFLYSILSALPAGGVLYLLKFNQTAIIAAFALSSICYKSVAHFISSRNKNNRFILFFVSFLPFISILLMFIFYLSTASPTQMLLYLAATIAFSIILRMTMAILDDRGSVFLLLVGFILFISEACAVLKLSPLVV
ncbi:MAG: hypothetical protein GY765_09665, partial [bacterium]|nr:hypothetical protein [bacterium]